MSRNNFHSTFGDYDDYNTFNLEKQKWSELRKEFRKLRKEAKKRIEELKESEFADSKILENKEYLYEDVSNMTKDELVRYTAYTASFLASDLSTVQGQQTRLDNAIEKFHDLGYENINKDNFKSFTQYMADLQPFIAAQIVGSETAVDLYDTAIEEGVSNLKRNLTSFLSEQSKKIKDMSKSEMKNIHKYTSQELWDILQKRDMLNEMR